MNLMRKMTRNFRSPNLRLGICAKCGKSFVNKHLRAESGYSLKQLEEGSPGGSWRRKDKCPDCYPERNFSATVR